jgi:hypothetical protein
MNEGWIEEYEALPKAGSHRLIDFERAEVWGLDSDPRRSSWRLVDGSRTRTCGWTSRR